RCRLCWFVAGLVGLTVASFWTLDLQWHQFLSSAALLSMARFAGEFFPPDLSALGTMLAAALGLALALPASRMHDGDRATARLPTRWLLNALRSIPELVWAALLLISAGLGPFAGTLAL